MNNLLLFDSTGQAIPLAAVRAVFELETGFSSIRYDTPAGTRAEAQYEDGDGSTTVRLSGNCQRISLSGVSNTALRVALVLQSHLRTPLRIVDMDYTFDLILSEYATLEDLIAAIEEAANK
jgi:hypothetical protein